MRAVNLLPQELRPSGRRAPVGSASQRSPTTGSPVGAYVVLGGLGALVLGVVVLVLAGNRIESRKAELASVATQQAQAQAELDRLQPYATFQDLAKSRLQTVNQIAGSRYSWTDSLSGVSRAIPADITLKELVATVAPGANTGGGSSADPLRASVSAPAFELTGCSRSQSGVARMMSNIKAVAGVDRVTLSKSVKPPEMETQDNPPCGLGRPAEFSMVVFFESQGATASAGAGTSGAPMTGAPTAPAAAPAAPAATPVTPAATPATPATAPTATSADPAATSAPSEDAAGQGTTSSSTTDSATPDASTQGSTK